MRILEIIEAIESDDSDNELARTELRELCDSAKEQGITLDINIGNDSVGVIWIGRDTAPKGVGAKIMRELCNIADRHDLVIYLHVAGGMRGLARYYERFDFEVDDPEDAEYPHADEESYGEEISMSREPRLIF